VTGNDRQENNLKGAPWPVLAGAVAGLIGVLSFHTRAATSIASAASEPPIAATVASGTRPASGWRCRGARSMRASDAISPSTAPAYRRCSRELPLRHGPFMLSR
jgi:hypothetical protein